jgi:hypothetical protein
VAQPKSRDKAADFLPVLEAEAKKRRSEGGKKAGNNRPAKDTARLPDAKESREAAAEAKPRRTRAKPEAFADVFLPRPTCGHCGAPEPRVYKTYPEETDGSRTQLAKCRSCGKRSRLILELATD